ncbi:serine hydrolase [Bradyrhizobium sp. STM 3809]|uniref:serine hydrolase domain-containing protein n=1 Tax=Bradyrhizobium sp. STM 3809 TaxID=551936 RepID=UPI0002ED15FF|nr:serine hydrolase [Bradyrhizobium sp. STM 3809]
MISRDVQQFADEQKPTAIMVVRDDEIIASSGDLGAKVNIRSERKSLISALYGIAVEEGRINLDSSLAERAIDDHPDALSPAEKTATVRHLLMARSGIYHLAAYETPQMKQLRPARGSHPAGSFWYYNNWDFNALGTIYRQSVGDVFKSFETRIARPLGMEDFSVKDGHYQTEASSSHPAYVFHMSARDLARFGVLYLNGGRWNGSQLIPAHWVTESTTRLSDTGQPERGYGYLWWTYTKDGSDLNAFFANGYGGQLVVIVPAKRLVVVELVDLDANPHGIRTQRVLDLVSSISASAP